MLLENGYGFADVSRRVASKPGTRFPIASISKPITATAVVLLAQDRVLSLEDGVGRYVPGYPRGDDITMRHLLGHTGGMPRWPADHPGLSAARTPGDFVALFRDDPLRFEPGTTFEYSNTGYMLLSHIIEDVSGLPYGDFLDRRMFSPLSLASFGHAQPGRPVDEIAVGYYQVAPGELLPADPEEAAKFPGAGSLYATAADLFRWFRSFVAGSIVDTAAVSAMLMEQVEGEPYGLGWKLGTRHDREIVEHNGALDGFRTWLTHYRQDDVTVIVLSNVGQTDAAQLIARDLAAIVLGEDYDVPTSRTFTEMSAEQLEALVGTYEFSPNFRLQVKFSNGQLVISVGGPFSPIYAESPTMFFHHRSLSEYSFERDSDGRGVSVTMRYRGRVFEGTRAD